MGVPKVCTLGLLQSMCSSAKEERRILRPRLAILQAGVVGLHFLLQVDFSTHFTQKNLRPLGVCVKLDPTRDCLSLVNTFLFIHETNARVK